MKKGKVIFASLILSVLSCNALQAQEKKEVSQENKVLSQEKKAELAAKAQENKDRLALTKEQQVPYREIIKRHAEKVREVRGSSLTPNEKREKVKVIMGEKDAEMKVLLTPEQFQTYTQIREERNAKFINMRK